MDKDMALEHNRVDSHSQPIKPPMDSCCIKYTPKAISNPVRHKQIKKAQFNKGIAEKCDIHKREE
jgi:hypothetical protein